MSDGHDHTWTKDHVYLGAGHARAESRTRFVVALAAIFMVLEIGAGFAFGSMALLADGVHMATHVGALGLAVWAYWMARRHAKNPRFSFGSGKFGDLAGFASALILGLVSLVIAWESAMRLYAPVPIQFREAIIVALAGLVVNIVSAFVLHEDEDAADAEIEEHVHGHAHGHAHADPAPHHHDHNLRAAYIHVLADAATSVLALAALIAASLLHWNALDPLVGFLGAIVIARWSVQLMKDAGRVLLDVEDDPHLAAAIRHTLESEGPAHVADLHLWRLGPGHRGLIVSLISPVPCSADAIKDTLRQRHKGLSHVTVEVAICEECPRV